MKTVSIITVCFNNKKGLIQTIESVKKQHFSDVEFILIDGGSTDGTLSVIQENESLFSYWVSEKDNGIYHAMNKGLEKATGKYCLFLNSGDYLVDEKVLENIFSQQHNEDILYGNIVKINKNKKRIITYADELTFLHFYKKEPAVHHQAAFIKTKLFSQYGNYREDTYLIADWIFFFTAVVLQNVSTKHLNLLVSVCDANGISNQKNMDIHPMVIKDRELKMKMIQHTIPDLALKDYQVLSSKKNKITSFKIKLLWRLSVLLPLNVYIRLFDFKFKH